MGLDTVEFILWAEKEFEIEIPDRDAEDIRTVGQFTNYVYQKLLEIDGTKATAEAEVFERIRSQLISEFKVAPEKISRSSTFIKDLGLDQ